MDSRVLLQIGVTLAGLLLAAARCAWSWRDMSAHLDAGDPRVRRGWRLGGGAALAGATALGVHGAALLVGGDPVPSGVWLGSVLALYALGLALFVAALRQFMALAPADYYDT